MLSIRLHSIESSRMFFKWADPSDTQKVFACLPYISGLTEGCPIHPTRVDSSLVFAIRSNRHESFPLVSIRYTGSRFAQDLENIASRLYAGWVENVVDSTRFDRIVTNRFLWCRFVIPEVDLRET